MTQAVLTTTPPTAALAAVIPIGRRADLTARADALQDFAWDFALAPRPADGGIRLTPADTATLTGLLPNLPAAAAQDHLERLVDWCDQARQAGAGDSGRQSQADRDDAAAAMDTLRRAAADAARADMTAGAA